VTIARHLVIHGRVQGVFYRGWAVGKARELGLAGWVRNRGDGTVEAVVEGDESAVERFIALAREGPPAASVERIDVSEVEPAALAGFEQRRTL
jgi:acylphosphatase